MSFPGLIVGLLTGLLLILGPTGAAASDPHLDPSLLPTGCPACHESHGASGSPMLPGPQERLCLSCHGARSDADIQTMRGNLATNHDTRLLSTTLALPFTHPLTEGAMSSKEVGSVTCTSCHSPHRSAIRTPRQARRPGELKPSTLDASRAEFELCQECHGARGIHTQDLNDISRLTNTANASFHPIEGPAPERSPSVTPEISGQRINCSDCHDNSDPNGPRGPHGSAYRYLLNRNYLTTDGAQESVQAYALCYGCHDRESLLTGPLFPQHASHVDRLRISCATCHNPHGSVENRSLIRFGEETSGGGVSPTLGIGRLAFESFGSGSGACWVSCHGVNHEPAIYGGGAAFVTQAAPGGTLDDVSPALAPEVELRILPRTQRERQRQRPPP